MDLPGLWAEWLKQGMKKRGLNQSQLARLKGAPSRDSISRIVRRKTKHPDEGTLQALSAVLDWPLPQLPGQAPQDGAEQDERLPAGRPASDAAFVAGARSMLAALRQQIEALDGFLVSVPAFGPPSGPRAAGFKPAGRDEEQDLGEERPA
jgi:transcriptional regulator with XRE-family HTH domain